MRSRAVVTAVVLAIMIMVPRLAGAVGVHYFDCKECHKTGMAITQLGDSNVCRQCHNDPTVPTLMNSGATVDPGTGFLAGDASNVYGTAQPTGNYTSHQFAAPSDVVAAAGAQAPSRTTAPAFYTRYGSSHGKVTCSRCHNPHGDATTNPLLLVTGANTTNQMCLACHVDFDKSANHGLVTHPLVADYAATVTAVNDAYKVAHPAWTVDDLPYKAAPDNGATNGNVSLVAGGVSCTSCHAVHFADSDASTTDSFGATAAGDGYLLKHNGPAKENPLTPGAGDSICQTCHNYQGHSVLTTHPIGCQVCHGGHAYDAGGSPNYYMLNKTITIDSAITPNPNDGPGDVTVNLDYTALDSKWMDGGAGYCEGCHDLGANHNGLTVGDSQTGCIDCHNHDQGTFTGGGCNTCHGYSPSSDTPGGPTGYAVDPDVVAPADSYKTAAGVVSPKNESLTAHLKHADQLDVGTGNYKFACTECHANYGTGHRDGNFQDVAFDALASGGGLTPAVYNPAGTGSCATLYCHSNGRAAATAATIPAWQGGSIATCAQCHGNDSATMGTRGNTAAHQAHLAKGYSCNVCHDGTAANNTTLAATAISGKLHVNGSADVLFDNAFDLGAALLGAGASGGGTCSIYCHSDGRGNLKSPDWAVAGVTCTSCHNNGTDNGVLANAAPTTIGAHAKHLSITGIDCSTCHGANDGTHAGHINGNIDAPAQAVCNACHGATAGGSGVDAEPVWTLSTSVTCDTCHMGAVAVVAGKTAPAKDSASTTGHGLASGNYTVSGNAAANQACASCHDVNAAGHFDGISDDDTRLIGGFSCATCHGTLITHQAATCVTCHDPHGSSNIYMVKATSTAFSGTVAFTATTGANSYDEADAANGDDICATCHTAANQTNQHNNKTNSGIAHNEGADCFNCHLAHTNPGNAFAVGGGDSCDSCHGFPPATAAHALHAPDSLLADAGGKVYDTADRSACEFCHTGAASYTYNTGTDQGNSLNHSNASGRATILAASVGYNGATCASACHDGASGLTAAWTDTALGCDACHYESATPSQAGNDADANALTGNHSTHFAASAVCADCHGTLPTDTAHITDRSGATELAKIQGMASALMDEATIDATVGADTDPGTATCNNAACHNPSGTTYSAEWTVANAVGCAFCHSETDPTTGSHTGHLAATVPTTFGKTVGCADCHDTLPISNAHRDGTVDFAAAIDFNNIVTDGCSTTLCHTDGTGVAVATPVWGRAASSADDCTICHGYAPATGRHAVHLANTVFVANECAECHTAETAATHIDGTLDDTVAFDGGSGGCANNCHLVSAATAGDWNDSAKLDCANCHNATGKTLFTGFPPAVGAHQAHTDNTAYVTGANCTDCHNDNSVTHSAIDSAVTSPTLGAKITTYTAGNGTCANSCHGGAADFRDSTPAPGCTDCHSGTYIGGGANMPTSGLHATSNALAHDASFGASYSCTSCHSATPSNAHVTGVKQNSTQATYSFQAAIASYSQAAGCAASCHTDGGDWSRKWIGVVDAQPAMTDAVTAAVCANCHGTFSGWRWNEANASTTDHTNPDPDNAGDGMTSHGQCSSCHGWGNATYISAGKHNNGNITMNGPAPTAGLQYDDATGGCAINCHGGNTLTMNSNSGWTADYGDYGGVGGCGACHADGALPPTSGSHAAHNVDADTDYSECVACHGDNAGAGYEVYTGLHNDGSVNFAAAVTYSGGASGTCSTTTCHSAGANTSTWGTPASVGCDECHYYSATPTAAANTSNANALSADHGNHFDTGAVCTTCHAAVTDLTHITDVSGADDGAVLTGMANALQDEAAVTVTSWNDGTNNCANAACHNPSGTTYSATWMSSTASCTLCHSATDPGTGSHDEHMGATTTFGLAVACTSCHGTLPVSNAHLNNVVNFAAGMNYTPAATDVGGTLGSCSTSTCHNDGTAAATAVPTPTWNTASANCSICHEGTPTSNKHSVHLASTNYVTGSCGDCHSAANTANHINGTRNLASKVTSATLAANGTCANTCHAVVDGRDWTAGPTLDCADCHGASGKTLYTASGSGGWPIASNKHAAHTGSNSLPQTGANDCFACHNGTVDNTGALIGGGSHLNTTFDVAFNSAYNYEATTAGKAGTGAATTCSNIRCHSGVTTPTWAAASSISCGKCHNTGGTGPLPSGSTLGSHAKHANNDGDFADCAQCHVGANSYSATGGLANHQNLTVNIVPTTGTYSDPDGAAGVNWAGDHADDGTCANSCHGASSPFWGNTGAVTCTSCHNDGNDSGLLADAVPAGSATLHATHIGANNGYVPNDCDACHGVGAISGTHTNHIDGVLGDGNATMANKVASYTSVTGTCANDCHNVTDGRDWTSGTNLACSDCHIGGGVKDLDFSAAPPTSANHPAHVMTMDSAYGATARKANAGGYNFACGQCHGSTLSNHLNTTINVAAATNYSLGSCSTNACHNDGRGGAPVEDPNWTTGFTAGDICGKCHGNTPTTAAHSVHAVGIHASDIYTGTTGLQSASATSPSAHGDGATSTVISCNSCHNNTVNVWYNANNSACTSCHDTSNGSLGDNAMVITGYNSHVNGTKEVVFQNIQVKSRAQVRDDITTVTDLNASWTRTNGYKANNSYDVAKANLNTATYVGGTCSAVACHNGNDATWQAPQNNCMACHTGLPK